MIQTRAFLVLGLSLIIGLGLFGHQVGKAVQKGRAFDRFLTVRGLAELEVKADLAIWPIKFSARSEQLGPLKTELETAKAKVVKFLLDKGVKQEELNFGLPSVQDREELKANTNTKDMARYLGSYTLVVRSPNVDLVKDAMRDADKLIADNVSLSSNDWDDRSQFLFTRLNEVKPDMIKTATANARTAAEKFAQDSGSRVGAIRKATQGLIEVEDRDPASPERKKLRVVTSIDFFLE